ncbi:Ribokinase-like protein [Mycena rebaudengoi]|nr:Ribokinase-like protein [Mycena rebaudengoi]
MHFVTLGMFIIDEFSFLDDNGKECEDSKAIAPQIGGGGTYASIGARIWLPPSEVGMIIDRGPDFPPSMETQLAAYGSVWMYRSQTVGTTRAMNTYRGDHRSFDYLTPRIRITPRDLEGTRLARPKTLHFICSPARASTIMSEVREIDAWDPTTIYEPIPDRCVPEELEPLKKILSSIHILSPNAEEAFGLLSIPLPPTQNSIEEAARRFLDLGIGRDGKGFIIIRSGGMGAYVATKGEDPRWVPAFWSSKDANKIVDVTGAGNSFLGGLAAGLLLERGDVYKATLYASVSASFIIEQEGLPSISVAAETTQWNGDTPERRLKELETRQLEPTD